MTNFMRTATIDQKYSSYDGIAKEPKSLQESEKESPNQTDLVRNAQHNEGNIRSPSIARCLSSLVLLPALTAGMVFIPACFRKFSVLSVFQEFPVRISHKLIAMRSNTPCTRYVILIQ